MRKKIIDLFICILLITTLLPTIALAGDENNPEITDNLNDQFGALVDHPMRIRTRIALTLLQMNSFDFIDINSAWFYENEFEPDFLYASLKLQDLKTIREDGIYSVRWTYNGTAYCVWSHIWDNGKNITCIVGVDKRHPVGAQYADVYYDFDTNIITFKMEKKYIGNPQPGDILIKTWAWTALRFNYAPLCLLFSDGELVKDAAPFIENKLDYGKNYVILY